MLFITKGKNLTLALFCKKVTELYVYYFRELITTTDGGSLALDWAPTKEGLEEDKTPTLVVLHGLTGGSYESYIRCLLEVVRIRTQLVSISLY
jgi:predicted alpha/beta-fold hydrolase